MTTRQMEFESYISIASSVPSSVTVITHMFIGNKFAVHGKSMLALVIISANNGCYIILEFTIWID